jgi:hypothetical protein
VRQCIGQGAYVKHASHQRGVSNPVLIYCMCMSDVIETLCVNYTELGNGAKLIAKGMPWGDSHSIWRGKMECLLLLKCSQRHVMIACRSLLSFIVISQPIKDNNNQH